MSEQPTPFKPLPTPSAQPPWRRRLAWAAGAAGLAALALAGGRALSAAQEAPRTAAAKPALTVTLAQPARGALAQTVTANGNVAAWQEAIVGAESNGLRLAEVHVNVGDVVRRGQVLATFASDVVQAELAQGRAAVAEAEAMLAEASANAQRARDLQASGALSEQQIQALFTAERTAQARLEAQRAMLKTQQLRLSQTRVLAPDHGVISARAATVGAVVPAGMELFRLVRQGRLEWRAEVAASELAQLRPGQPVRVTPAGGSPVVGQVRIIAPTVDAATRNGLVYVDLPAGGGAKAGMFARGEFEVGKSAALLLPQTAVQLRDGFAYVFTVDGEQRVAQQKVQVGRRAGDRIEITGGLTEQARVVASGVGFLADGDTVRVVAAPASPAAPAAAQARPAAAAPSAPR